MKLRTPVLLFAISVLTCTAAFAATRDDVKRINRCVSDNKGDAKDDVVLKYCTCMNNKMGDNKTQSITQWEKSHSKESAACDKESGWE